LSGAASSCYSKFANLERGRSQRAPGLYVRQQARSAPRPHEIANSEIEADKHHERDKPLIALGRTVRDDKHALVVEVRSASPQEGASFWSRALLVLQLAIGIGDFRRDGRDEQIFGTKWQEPMPERPTLRMVNWSSLEVPEGWGRLAGLCHAQGRLCRADDHFGWTCEFNPNNRRLEMKICSMIAAAVVLLTTSTSNAESWIKVERPCGSKCAAPQPTAVVSGRPILGMRPREVGPQPSNVSRSQTVIESNIGGTTSTSVINSTYRSYDT
jgi:hypothetical protein